MISNEALLQKVWPDTFVEELNLAYNIFALRKALEDTVESSRYIETVPKNGYRFRASVRRPVRWASPDATPPRAVSLTSLPGVVRSPSLSPDGTYVVFSWNGPNRHSPDLYVQQIGVTAPPYRLTSDAANDFSPSWSSDGRTVAFRRRGPAGGKSEVWRIAPLGGPERKVAEIQPRLPSFRPTSLTWHPGFQLPDRY